MLSTLFLCWVGIILDKFVNNNKDSTRLETWGVPYIYSIHNSHEWTSYTGLFKYLLIWHRIGPEGEGDNFVNERIVVKFLIKLNNFSDVYNKHIPVILSTSTECLSFILLLVQCIKSLNN